MERCSSCGVMTARPAGALATLMNSRGLTELVILTVGLDLKVLDTELFSLMVVMALVTTAMAGPILAVNYPKRLIERDIADAEKAQSAAQDADFPNDLRGDWRKAARAASRPAPGVVRVAPPRLGKRARLRGHIVPSRAFT